MSQQRFSVSATVNVFVTVINPDVIERVTGPNGDEWRDQFYGDMFTTEDVVEHLVYNAIHNQVRDVSRLDGWADLDEDAVDFRVTDGDYYTTEV